jgi:hypothetical protein
MADMSATATPGHTPASDAADSLTAAHAQARAQAEGGDLTGARTLLEDALAVGEVRFGHDHPRLAPLMVDLATIARGLGNLTEALTQIKRAYAIVVASAGPEHATSLSIEGRLAAVLYRLGEPTEAYDWHLADVGTRILGAEHPAVRGARQRLATAPAEPPPELHPSATGRAAVPEHPWEPDEDVQPGLAPTYAPTSAPTYPPPEAPGIYVVNPPPREYQAVEVWQEPPLPYAPPARRRGHGGGVALVASLGTAVIIGAAVVAFQLFRPDVRTSQPPLPTVTIPTVAAPSPTTDPPPPPPTGVTLADKGGSITLTWIDPSEGKVSFVVAGGRVGTPSQPLESVPAGRTTFTVYGLNNKEDYCFTVAAVWSSDSIAPSTRTCTHRSSASRTP